MIISFPYWFSIQFVQARINQSDSKCMRAISLRLFTLFVSTAQAVSHWNREYLWEEGNTAELEVARTLWLLQTGVRQCLVIYTSKLGKIPIVKPQDYVGYQSSPREWMEESNWTLDAFGSSRSTKIDELRSLEQKPRGRAPSVEGIGNLEGSVFVISRGAKFDRTKRIRSEFFSRPRRTHRGHFWVYLGVDSEVTSSRSCQVCPLLVVHVQLL